MGETKTIGKTRTEYCIYVAVSTVTNNIFIGKTNNSFQNYKIPQLYLFGAHNGLLPRFVISVVLICPDPRVSSPRCVLNLLTFGPSKGFSPSRSLVVYIQNLCVNFRDSSRNNHPGHYVLSPFRSYSLL
jgi:hypothetical protein